MSSYAEVLAENVAAKAVNETKDQVVRNMLSDGRFTDAEIAGYSGASLRRVQEIRSEENKKNESLKS